MLTENIASRETDCRFTVKTVLENTSKFTVQSVSGGSNDLLKRGVQTAVLNKSDTFQLYGVNIEQATQPPAPFVTTVGQKDALFTISATTPKASGYSDIEQEFWVWNPTASYFDPFGGLEISVRPGQAFELIGDFIVRSFITQGNSFYSKIFGRGLTRFANTVFPYTVKLSCTNTLTSGLFYGYSRCRITTHGYNLAIDDALSSQHMRVEVYSEDTCDSPEDILSTSTLSDMDDSFEMLQID